MKFWKRLRTIFKVQQMFLCQYKLELLFMKKKTKISRKSSSSFDLSHKLLPLQVVVLLNNSIRCFYHRMKREKDLRKICQKLFCRSLWAFIFGAIERITDPAWHFLENLLFDDALNQRKIFNVPFMRSKYHRFIALEPKYIQFFVFVFYLLMQITYQLS